MTVTLTVFLVLRRVEKSKYAFIDSNFARSLPATFDKKLEKEKFPFFLVIRPNFFWKGEKKRNSCWNWFFSRMVIDSLDLIFAS